MKDREESRKDAPLVDAGDFELDGRWTPFTPAAHRGPLYAFVKRCIETRRFSSDSPAEFAASIKTTHWIDAFPSAQAGEWDHLTFDKWANAPCRTSAEEAIKRCGYGSEGHWEGGSWRPGEDERKLEPLDPAKIAGLINTLGRVMEAK